MIMCSATPTTTGAGEYRFLTWARRILFVCLFAYAGFTVVGTIWWPMGRDQGIFAWIGDVIVRGGMPFRDGWDTKGPATYYTFALVEWVFGRTLWGIRVFDLIFLTASATALWRLLDNVGGNLAARAGTLIFVFLYIHQGYWSTAQADGWATMSLVFALYLVFVPGPAARLNWFAAGMFVGLAVLYKSTYLAFILPVGIAAARGPRVTPRAVAGRAAGLAAGCTVVLLLALGWLALRGALKSFLEIQFEFNPRVYRLSNQRSWLDNVREVYMFLSAPLILVQLPFFSFGIISFWRFRRVFALSLATFTAVAVAIVVVQSKYYEYHWTPMFVPLAAFTALGITALSRALKTPAVRAFLPASLSGSWILAMVLLVLIPARPRMHRDAWSAHLSGVPSPEHYYARFGTYGTGDFSFLADQQVADYLRKRTGDTDRVLVWGLESLINYLSGRAAPTRFGFDYPLVVGNDEAMFQRYRDEFMEDLAQRDPAYIVVVDHDESSLMKKTSKQYLEQFDAFSSFLSSRYVLETTIEHFEVWRRRDKSGGSNPDQTEP